MMEYCGWSHPESVLEPGTPLVLPEILIWKFFFFNDIISAAQQETQDCFR